VKPARSHPWYDVAWPITTGLVCGAGLLAAYRWTGPGMFVVAFVVLEVTVAPVAWSLLTDLGFGVRRVTLRVAPVGAVALLAVIGLADVIGAWTYVVAVLVVASSPLTRGWRELGLRGLLADRLATHSETRRRFDEIVAHGFSPQDDETPG
jgi:hypothetical protein